MLWHSLWGRAHQDEPERADIVFSECGAIVRTVAVSDLQRTLAEMEFRVGMCATICPHCKREDVFTGFTEMLAYTCRDCAKTGK